jgi:beta-mannosidase
MDLGGEWLVAASSEELRRVFADPDHDDTGWLTTTVPGHWRAHPAFATSDGPILYRRRFRAPPAAAGRRSWLTCDGIFYQGDVWLDGEYLGDTEGYFAPHTFEVGPLLAAREEHVLAIEVTCSRPDDLTAKRNLTGIFQHWDCIDPDWNPGGIWAPVHLDQTGRVRIRSLKVLCREANADAAALDLEAELDTVDPVSVQVHTAARRHPPGAAATAQRTDDHTLAAGVNQVRWRLVVERPDLWWPHALGGQPLYDIDVDVVVAPTDPPTDPPTATPTATPTTEDTITAEDTVTAEDEDTVTAEDALTAGPAAGLPTDHRRVTTGLRQVRLRNFVATINGERLFLKGANLGPTRRALADASPDELAGDVALARQAGLDLLRVHAHITRTELYEAADREGMLIWQDLPLQWGYGQVRRQAASQARQAVTLLGHHPAIAVWCGHNEPVAVALTPGTAPAPRAVARMVAGQVLPTWNKTALDRSIRRALERADGSRAVVSHSGILPHPAWGTDSHLYFGWYHGDERDFPAALARFPVLARFVSEFGAQAVPPDAAFMHPERWPDLDWEHLETHHVLQRATLDKRVPPGPHPTFDSWRAATQAYQVQVLRHHIETLRRLKYRPTGGFCVFMFADAQPAVSWSILDHQRNPKAGYHAVAAACAPVIITATRPRPGYGAGDQIALDLHAISDLRRSVDGAVASATLRWPGGTQSWRFAGDVPADSCVRIGRVEHTLAAAPAGPLTLDVSLHWDGGIARNSYASRVW